MQLAREGVDVDVVEINRAVVPVAPDSIANPIGCIWKLAMAVRF
jgi:hypothetical protein